MWSREAFSSLLPGAGAMAVAPVAVYGRVCEQPHQPTWHGQLNPVGHDTHSFRWRKPLRVERPTGSFSSGTLLSNRCSTMKWFLASKSNLFPGPAMVKAEEAPGATVGARRKLAAAATTDMVEFGSAKYYALCGVGGILSCGITHTLVTPLDLVKCRLQVDKERYKNLPNGFKVTYREGGPRGLVLGWAPTCIGYSMQGLCKFGFYEVFKNLYSNLLGEENSYVYRTSLYLAASASAEFFADIALSPMESVKVRMQTSKPGTFPTTLREAFPKIAREEGLNGFYKSVGPLWGRQIPYTMMKFACFERTVEALYLYVVPKPRAECTKGEQLVVTFAAGYIAGVFCAIVSHPADTIVSYMNKAKGSTVGSAARALGMKGMWAGLGPRIIMIGTLTALQWFIYDGVKVALKLPRPPPPAMPESLKKKLEAAQQ